MYRRKKLNSIRVTSFNVFKKNEQNLAHFSTWSGKKQVTPGLILSIQPIQKVHLGSDFGMRVSMRRIQIEKEEENSNYGTNLKVNEFRTKKAVSFEVHKVKAKWNRERYNKFCWRYEKESKRTQIRYQKSACELKKEISKTYDIRAFF